MRSGLGKRDLTPPLGAELAGYGYYLNRRAARVTDPLYARAVYIQSEEEQALLVSCDVLGLSRAIADEVRARLAQRGFKAHQVMLVSVHTHTASALIYHEGCGNVDARYRDTVAGRILEACEDAILDATPVTALMGAFAPVRPGFAYNRACENGSVDNFARGFVLKRGDRAPISVVSFACHAVCRGRSNGVSADYPGEVNRQMEAEGYQSIFANGLCGDIDPVMPEDEDRDARMRAFAREIRNAFASDLAPLAQTLFTGSAPFELRLQPVTREEIVLAANAAARRAGSEDAPAARVARVWQSEMLARFDGLSFTQSIRIPFFALGGRILLALPFEGFSQIGAQLRARLGMPEALALGCADEILGYLPTRDDIARGAYAALESTFLYKRLPVKPGEAERLSEALPPFLPRA